MYSGKYPCSLIINNAKKNVIQTKQMILFTFVFRTQVNIEPVYFTFSPENYATFAQELNSDFIVRFILVRFVIVTKGNRI